MIKEVCTEGNEYKYFPERGCGFGGIVGSPACYRCSYLKRIDVKYKIKKWWEFWKRK